jgi:hypothetical protein
MIALYVHDKIIRPYIGDVLVVILIYCFCKSFMAITVSLLAWRVLLFSYFVEFLQYINFIALVGLEKYKLARILIGTAFSWLDIIAYSIGIFVVICLENYFSKHKM